MFSRSIKTHKKRNGMDTHTDTQVTRSLLELLFAAKKKEVIGGYSFGRFDFSLSQKYQILSLYLVNSFHLIFAPAEFEYTIFFMITLKV